jgi:hypothetical protein
MLINYLGSVSCQQVAYEVNYLSADFLAITTKGSVNARYRGSQILPRAHSAQRGVGVELYCFTV